MAKHATINAFNLVPGETLADKYEVEARLGGGWEGEVYQVVELGTRIERTAKLFYPHRNLRDQASRTYAKKLHRLRNCPVVIQYHGSEELEFKGFRVTCLVSEYVEGELLNHFLARQRDQVLSPFQALHLLHALALGIEQMHLQGEYHGDLHPENVIVTKYGLGFDLKLLDFYHWGRPSGENFREDLYDMIKIFYDCLGGRRAYRHHPSEVKEICCGLRRDLIRKRFRRVSNLRAHLESMTWS